MKSKKTFWSKKKRVTLKEHYDRDVDILDFYWGGKKGTEHSRELDIHVVVDFDKKDNIVGIEIWDFSEALKESQNEVDKIFAISDNAVLLEKKKKKK